MPAVCRRPSDPKKLIPCRVPEENEKESQLPCRRGSVGSCIPYPLVYQKGSEGRCADTLCQANENMGNADNSHPY